MPIARLGGGNNFALYWLNLVENYGSGVDLKIVLAWFWHSHVGFQTWCQFFILNVMFICTYTFLNHKLFENHCMHLLLILALLRD